MKFFKPLDTILNTETKTRILRFLCRTNAEWNGRQIAKEIGITPAATHAALNSLYKEGVLQLCNMGSTHVYSLKQDSFLVSSLLKPLFAKEDKILDAVIEMIKRKILSYKAKKEILSVALFGSTSVQQETPVSDIDIAVVVENAKIKAAIEPLFEEVNAKVAKEFGNTISPYVNTQAEFKTKHKQGLAVIKNILKSYRLIYGKRLENLL
ncbi:MAG: winged helix-turn-helix transcriptional regulator [Candidatus Omnitrophica bacterium]|nr:winged helix-turn-helix transcriptional regulator [Candidatus Omnitrophota bacterium]